MAGLLLATTTMADLPPARAPTDQIDVKPHGDVLELSWSDAEDRLQGSISPSVPREGQPLRVSLQVGSFEGDPFDGPLVLTLREGGATHGRSVTVARGTRHWEATFTPEHDGPHLLDVTFLTTRHKALHAPFEVGASLVPRMLGWGLLGLGCLALLGYTVRNLLRRERPESPPETSVAGDTTPSGPDAAPTIEPPGTPPSADQ